MRWIIAHTNAFGLLLIVSLAFNAGFALMLGAAVVHHSFDGGDGVVHEHASRLREHLGLSTKQEAGVNGLGDKLFKRIEHYQIKLRVETDALVDLMTVDAPDHALILQQLERIGTLRRQIEIYGFKHFVEVREFLREDQRPEFDLMMRKHILRYNGLNEDNQPGEYVGHPGEYGRRHDGHP